MDETQRNTVIWAVVFIFVIVFVVIIVAVAINGNKPPKQQVDCGGYYTSSKDCDRSSKECYKSSRNDDGHKEHHGHKDEHEEDHHRSASCGDGHNVKPYYTPYTDRSSSDAGYRVRNETMSSGKSFKPFGMQQNAPPQFQAVTKNAGVPVTTKSAADAYDYTTDEEAT